MRTRGDGQPVGKPGRLTVLVADDDGQIRNLLKTWLERAGHFVLPAADGEQALVVSRSFSGSIDCLITDMNMPGMTGCELAGSVIRERPGIRVLIISGLPQELCPSDVPVLKKPFGTEALLSALAELG